MTKAEIDAMSANELRRDMAGTMAALDAERAKVKQLEAEKAELIEVLSDCLGDGPLHMVFRIREIIREVQS